MELLCSSTISAEILSTSEKLWPFGKCRPGTSSAGRLFSDLYCSVL